MHWSRRPGAPRELREALIAAAAFVFPIPLAALSGIALPLPDSISRIAADVAHATGTVLPGIGGGDERPPAGDTLELAAPVPAAPAPRLGTARDARSAPPAGPAVTPRRPVPVVARTVPARTSSPRPAPTRPRTPVAPKRPAPPRSVVQPPATASPAVPPAPPSAAVTPPPPVPAVPPPPTPPPPPVDVPEPPPLPVDIPPLPPLDELPAPVDQIVPPAPAPLVCLDALGPCPPDGSGG